MGTFSGYYVKYSRGRKNPANPTCTRSPTSRRPFNFNFNFTQCGIASRFAAHSLPSWSRYSRLGGSDAATDSQQKRFFLSPEVAGRRNCCVCFRRAQLIPRVMQPTYCVCVFSWTLSKTGLVFFFFSALVARTTHE
jgi:hypothetical protein